MATVVTFSVIFRQPSFAFLLRGDRIAVADGNAVSIVSNAQMQGGSANASCLIARLGMTLQTVLGSSRETGPLRIAGLGFR